MSNSRAAPILAHLRRLAGGGAALPPDADLLQRYLDRSDQSAFAALVERHGPMVLNVCRSVLRHCHDAEDAFQATFLVLAYKAASIRRRDSVASWLHGVAHRVALKARAGGLRRQALEAKATPPPAGTSPADDLTWTELREILHTELAALPERFREPLLLCYLEGLTQEEAAGRLGWSTTTVKGRIQRGRDLLRAQLERRGLTLAAALTAALTGQTLVSPLRAALAEATSQAATRFLTQTTTATPAALLARGALQQMATVNWQLVSAALVTAGLVASGIGLWPRQPASKEPVVEKSQPLALRRDPHGDPLPDGAIARLGTLRFNHGDGLSNIRFDPDGKTMVSTGGGIVRLWDVATGKELGQFSRATSSWDDEIVLSPDGKMLISLGQEVKDTLHFWDLTQHKEVRRVELSGQRKLWSVDIRNALSADGRLALINMPDQVRVFDIATARQLWRIPRAEAEKQAAVFAGNDRVVTVDKKHTIEVWEAQTGKSVQSFKQEAPAEVVAASPDGRRLATLEHHVHAIDKFLDQDMIHLWDLTTRTERRLAARPKRWYMNLLFTPDSKRLLSWSSGMDGFELAVWDADGGERLHELSHAVGQHMDVSPDGTRLAAGRTSG